MENKYAIEVNSVSKSFGVIKAVKKLSFKVKSGAIHGLLGPSASGKSTLMKMMVGLLKPDTGDIKILGVDLLEDIIGTKSKIGYVPESMKLYEYLTGNEYLDFVADIHDISKDEKNERMKKYLKAFQLENRKHEWISNYSQGMKQKIGIIAALLHKPRLLILDEPLSGLDPRGAKIVKDLLRNLANRGVTTILSTHVLGIAEAMCDKISIMYQGRILSEGTIDELKEKTGMKKYNLEEVFFKITETTGFNEIVKAIM
jgi:ABC-2 type transport system ATP-binding protein